MKTAKRPSTTAICRAVHDLAAKHGAKITELSQAIIVTLPAGSRWVFSRERSLIVTIGQGGCWGDVWALTLKAMQLGTYEEPR